MSLYKLRDLSKDKNHLQLIPESGDGIGIEPKESNWSSINEDEIGFDMTDLSKIRKILECPICLDIMRKTTTTQCGHHFCKECIEKSMRIGTHKCPSCRVHIPSRRSLRPNEKYDRFISMMFPDDNQYQKEELELNETERIHKEQTKATTSQTLKLQSEPNSRKPSTIVETPRGDETISRRIPRRKYNDDRGNGGSCNYQVQVRGLTKSQPCDSKDKDNSAGDDHCVRVVPIIRRKNPTRRRKRANGASSSQPSDEGGSDNSKEEYLWTNGTPRVLPKSLKWGRSSMRSSIIRKRNLLRNRIERLVAFLPNL